MNEQEDIYPWDTLENLHGMLDQWESWLPNTQIRKFGLVTTIAPELMEWVRYEKESLYQQMLDGKEIGLQHLIREYQSVNN